MYFRNSHIKKNIYKYNILIINNLQPTFFIYKSRFLACLTQNLESQNQMIPMNLF